MAIKVGCFALIDPFSVLEHQLDRIRDWGFKYADVTDSTDGGSMGVEYGFAAVASLDANPYDSTLEIAGDAAVLQSYAYLKALGAE